MNMSNDAMSHEQALRSQAVERYVLGELTPEERQAFEGHYFDCSACFEQVKLSAQFLRHAREVLDPEPEKGWLARTLGDLRRPAAAFASAMLLCAVGIGVYQQTVIADLRAPRVEASYTLAGDARGTAKVVSVTRKTGLSLRQEFVRKPEFVSYQAQIISDSGKVKATLPIPASVTEDSVTVTLPANALAAGKYAMVVYGLSQDGTRTEAGRGEFELQFAN